MQTETRLSLSKSKGLIQFCNMQIQTSLKNASQQIIRTNSQSVAHDTK